MNARLTLPSAGDTEQLVRAKGTLFVVTDRNGDITPPGARELGLFYHDTRHLASYALEVSGGNVVRLSAETTGDAYNQVDLMLSGIEREGLLDDPQNYLHIRRRQMLEGGFSEQIALTSFLRRRARLALKLSFGTDFADMFEVRGATRKRRGNLHAPLVEGRTVTLRYTGVCGTEYVTILQFGTAPLELTAEQATFELELGPDESSVIEVDVTTARGSSAPGAFLRRASKLEEAAERFRASATKIVCDNARLQEVLDRSVRDLGALRLDTDRGTTLAAGIPWFCAPFGRDALIASYEALTLAPDLASESLRLLAAYQGTKDDETTEEEPGKIFHELRFGEMVRAGEIPHSPYYGSVDATPLFVVVLDATYQVTTDLTLLKGLAPNLRAALGWIDRHTENGTRPLTYARKTAKGLENQGWKDSRAGVSFPDGRPAEPPIALIEVQGYCADAYRRGARLLGALDDAEAAATYRERGERMRELIEHTIWLDDVRRYAFAIDGHGRPLNTAVSNVGHLLWSRVPREERAAATARQLVGHASFSGFGIRTLAAGQPVYNPLSYHNGTVWPHDNALIARGFCNYGFGEEALKVFDGLYQAMVYLRDDRIPELYCGMARRDGPLVRYPVACSPQAWAAAAPFLLLQSILGLHADAPNRRLWIKTPRLPSYVRRVDLRDLRIGSSVVTMRFRRVGARCHVDRLDVAGSPLRTQIEIE